MDIEPVSVGAYVRSRGGGGGIWDGEVETRLFLERHLWGTWVRWLVWVTELSG